MSDAAEIAGDRRGTPDRPPATTAAPAARSEILLEVTGLQKHFPVRSGVLLSRQVGAVQAVDGLDFDVSGGARPSAWSGSPAAARPPPAGC